MTLREYAAIVSTVFILVGTSWYIYLALWGTKVRPNLAGWIVNSVGTILSFTTYLTSPKHSLISNAYNATSVLTVNFILISAIIVSRHEKKGLLFSPFQKKCLWCSLMIAIFWVVLVWGFRGTGIIPNLLTQVMMIIGYIVIGEKIWRSSENTESLFAWWCIVLASCAGMVTAAVSNDWLASIFAGRVFFGSLILVGLMHRVEHRAKKNKS